MAIERLERYLVKKVDGTMDNALCSSFQEVLALYGEENVEMIEKLEYKGEKHE